LFGHERLVLIPACAFRVQVRGAVFVGAKGIGEFACERLDPVVWLAMILVPAVAYYEVPREIERRTATSQGQRLRQYCFQPDRFIPLTTAQLELAAALWGQARGAGIPTRRARLLWHLVWKWQCWQ
jgi:hypothetical protein